MTAPTPTEREWKIARELARRVRDASTVDGVRLDVAHALARYREELVREERKACAKACESIADANACAAVCSEWDTEGCVHEGAERCVAAIRARGEE